MPALTDHDDAATTCDGAPLAEPCRVLLVEDGPGDALLIRTALATAPPGELDLVTVTDLASALTRLAEAPADVVLLDLGLPDSQGLATFETVHAAHPNLPVIVLTGLEDDVLALRAVREGAQDYVVKGSLVDHHLVRIVRHAVERNQLVMRVARLAAQREALVSLSRHALENRAPDDLLQQAAGLLAKALDVDRVAVVEYGEDRGAVVRAAVGWDEPVVGARLDDGVFAGGRDPQLVDGTVVVDRLADGTPPPLPGCQAVRSGASVAIPMPGGRTTLLFALSEQVREYDDETLGVLRTAANILSEALRRVRAERSLTERVKELTAGSAVSRLTQEIEDPDAMVAAVATALVPAVQFPADVVARVELQRDGARRARAAGAAVAPNAKVVEELVAPVRYAGHSLGRVSIGYVRPHGFSLPFEQNLVDGIAEKLGLWLERHVAVTSLAAREREQQLLLSQLPGTVWATDRELRFTRSVGSSLADLGRRPDEVVGRPLASVATPEALAAHERALAGEETDYVWRERGGVWQAHVQPLRDRGGDIVGVVGVGIDITEREQTHADLEDSRRRLQGIFDSALDGILLLDDDGRLVDVNPAVCALTGVPREELVGHPVGNPGRDSEPSDRLLARLREQKSLAFTTTLRHRDGHEVEIEAQARADVVPGLHMVMVRDVTEQRRAERQVEAGARRFRSLVQSASDLVLVVDRSGRATYLSPASAHILGVPPEEFVGGRPLDVVDGHDRDRARVAWQAAVDSSQPTPPVTLEVRHADGTRRWLECVMTNLLGDPVVSGVVINARDVTDRIQAERARRRTEERLRFVFEQLPGVVWTVDRDLEITSHVGRAHEQTDIGAGSLVGEPGADVVGPGSPGLEAATRAIRHGESSRYTEYFASRWWDTHVDPLRESDGTIVGAVGLALDITDVKLAEHELEQSRRRLEGLFENSLDAILLADNEGRYIDANPAAEQLTGYSRDELLSMSLDDLTEEGRGPESADRFRAFLASGRASGSFPMRRRDGTLIDTEFRASANIVPGIHLSVIRDVTERHRTEAALRVSEERFRRLAENAQDVIFRLEFSAPPTFAYVSPAIQSMIGYAPEEVYADPGLVLDLVHPDDRARFGLRLDRPRQRSEPIVVRWRRRDGGYVWIDMRHTLIRNDLGKIVGSEGIIRDVTDRIEAEEHLRQALEREHEAAEHLRRLDEMKNTFLTAVSHELRTPLTALSGFAQLLRAHETELPQERRRELLDRLVANAERLGQLLAQLLDLDRLTRGALSLQAQQVDLATVVAHTVELAATEAAGRVHVTTEPTVVHVDVPKIERVVENLVANALRHTPDGTAVHVLVAPRDGGALLVVEDDGPGVADGLKATIFEPFRMGDTAAARVGGTGIGLSIVSRFAELHGGRAWVEDRRDGGASFRVWLPAVPTDPARPGPQPTNRPGPQPTDR